MNVAYNTALRQSKAIRNELSSLDAKQLTPGEIGNVSASLSSFSKALDDYSAIARQEIVPRKQEEALVRVRSFRTELTEFRGRLDELRRAQNRTEVLGRRPYQATPENPYSTNSSSHSNDYTSTSSAHPTLSTGGDDAREAHAFREQGFFASTNQALDEYIARGQAVLGDLGQQREALKGTQRRLYSVGNTLGLSGETMRMVERRAREDKWIFGGGAILFFAFCWLVLHFLP